MKREEMFIVKSTETDSKREGGREREKEREKSGGWSRAAMRWLRHHDMAACVGSAVSRVTRVS